MMTPTMMIKSMIITVTTMMAIVVAPSLWGVSVGLVLLLLLLTSMVVAPSLWRVLVGCILGVLEVDAVEGKHTCGISRK